MGDLKGLLDKEGIKVNPENSSDTKSPPTPDILNINISIPADKLVQETNIPLIDNENAPDLPVLNGTISIVDEIVDENQQVIGTSSGIAIMLPNYPNPFSGQTSLGYQLNEDAVVTINVYDYTGRMVKTFAEGYKEIGEHHLSFTPDNLVSGIYFCYITANGSLCNAQKIILQK